MSPSLALLSLLASTAVAAPPDQPVVDAAPGVMVAPATDGGEAAPKAKKAREMQMEIGFRFRRMTVPRGLFNAWYANKDTAGWPLPGEDRPSIQGWSYGLEWVFKKGNTNGIIWFDYVDSTMGAGYWDDLNEEPPNRTDGDYLVPHPNLGLVTFGGDYAYEVDMVKLRQTRGAFGMSFLVGAGLGLGVLVGQIDEWSQGAAGEPAYQLYKDGVPAQSEKKVPRVYPIVDVNLGLRFNFGDRVSLRLEGGLHTMLFYGAALGVRF